MVISASAPDVPPFNIIPVSTLPKKSPCACSASESKSTFKVVDVEEYDEGMIDALPPPASWTVPGVPEYVSNDVDAVWVV